MRHPMLAALAALTVLTLAACGGDEDTAGVVADGAPRDTFTVTVTADESGADRKSWTLTCEPAGGTHPDPAAACAALAAADDPFAPVPPDVACTEIYGGPEVATITGSADGRQVDARYTRTNGCEIARWDALAAVFPGSAAGQPVPVASQ